MKARRGFLLAYDKDRRTMIPFFLKVRSDDIVPTNPVQIDSVLVPTSMRWEEVRVEEDVDVTVYKYAANWTDRHDVHNETVDPLKFTGELLYKLYKDGRMELYGDLDMEFMDTDTATGLLEYSVHLPYAFPEARPVFDADWKFVDLPDLIVASYVEAVPITNAELNKETGTNPYPYRLKALVGWDHGETGSKADRFKALALKLDPKYTSGKSISDYLRRFQLKLNYTGWWRPEKLPDVVVAESFDDQLVGLYTTIGMVAMLSCPSTTDGVTIRAIPMHATVRNHGYYTDVDGVRWLLCLYQATSENGYIPLSMLTTG